MKRILSVIIFLFVMCSVFGQAKATFSTKEYDFGIIPYGKPATAVITVTNSGNKPLVINKVSTSCGCAVAQWDSKAIEPGASSKISVEYDAMLMGHFYKEVSVYCNAQPYLYDIALVGEVSNTKVDYTKTHPFRMGDVLIDKAELLFDDVQLGRSYTKEISIVNMGEEVYNPQLILVPPYLEVEYEPQSLKHRQLGTIKVTLNADKMRTLGVGLTETSVYVARYPGDKVCEETNIPVSAFVLPDVPEYNESELANAPKLFVSATEWKVDTRRKRKKYSKTIEISNYGKSELVIEHMQISGRMLSASLGSKVIKPGGTSKMKITVNPKSAGRSKSGRVYIITNDPSRLKEVITVHL